MTRELLRRPEAVAGGLMLLLLIATALFAPLLSPGDPLAIAGRPLIHPFTDAAFPLGTDRLGRDLLAGIIHGARTSIAVGLAAALVALLVGMVVGTLAGFAGGLADEALMRVVDAFQIVPGFLLALAFVSVTGPSLSAVVLAIALGAWTGPARLARARVLSLREADFVAAARVMGMHPAEIAFRQIMPLALPPVLALTAIIVAGADADRIRPLVPRARRPQRRHLGRHDRRGAQPAALGGLPLDHSRHRARADGDLDLPRGRGADRHPRRAEGFVTAPLLGCRDLSVRYGAARPGAGPTSRSTSSPARGSRVIGESGSGKTTLARAVAGLLPEGSRVSGEIRWAGGPPRLGRDIGYVFQDPGGSLDPLLVGRRALGRGAARSLARCPAPRARARAGELLARVRIPEPEQALAAYPHQFSGGQRQRIAIALAIAAGPKLLIADEPTSSLDVLVQAEIVALLRQLCDDGGMTLLFVTHDMALAGTLADRSRF